MPASKHRRQGKTRPQRRAVRQHDPSRQANRGRQAEEIRLSPELVAELELVRRVLRERHGVREPSKTELEDALASLSGRLPLTNRLLHELDHNDPDGTLARVLLAVMHGRLTRRPSRHKSRTKHYSLSAPPQGRIGQICIRET